MKPTKITLQMTLEVDQDTGNVVAVYFYIRKGKSAHIKEFAQGRAFADYDKKGYLLGIELLAPCEIKVLDKIASKEPAPVKNFLRASIPREMALAES
jgi:uncharacterized protein YuzE